MQVTTAEIDALDHIRRTLRWWLILRHPGWDDAEAVDRLSRLDGLAAKLRDFSTKEE